MQHPAAPGAPAARPPGAAQSPVGASCATSTDRRTCPEGLPQKLQQRSLAEAGAPQATGPPLFCLRFGWPRRPLTSKLPEPRVPHGWLLGNSLAQSGGPLKSGHPCRVGLPCLLPDVYVLSWGSRLPPRPPRVPGDTVMRQ